MNLYIQRAKESPFVRHNAIFFAGSLLIGFLNYLYYPVLGRLMRPAVFGEVQTLVSLFLQITIFLTVLGLLSINIVTNVDDVRQRNRLILELEKLAILVSVVFLSVSILLGPWLRDYFNFGSPLPFSLLALAIAISVPLTFRGAYLRAKQHFGHNSITLVVAAGTNLVLSATLVASGLRTSGAMVGLVLSQLLAFGYAARFARKYGFTESLKGHLFRLPDIKLIRPELIFAFWVLISSLSITVMYSVDIVMVKHYFDAKTAGLYAGIATIARILFFLTASIGQVMMPAIKLKLSARENRRTFLYSLALVTAVGGSAVVVFYVAPHLIIGILMGKTYQAYADLLPRLSLAIFIISVLNLFMGYFIAVRYFPAAIITGLGAAITFGLMYTHHQSLGDVINSLLIGSVAMIAAMAALWIARARPAQAEGALL
jgi:O-antigen/teichoic acid export membrane protein